MPYVTVNSLTPRQKKLLKEVKVPLTGCRFYLNDDTNKIEITMNDHSSRSYTKAQNTISALNANKQWKRVKSIGNDSPDGSTCRCDNVYYCEMANATIEADTRVGVTRSDNYGNIKAFIPLCK